VAKRCSTEDTEDTEDTEKTEDTEETEDTNHRMGRKTRVDSRLVLNQSRFPDVRSILSVLSMLSVAKI